MIKGIYKITNLMNNKSYIGQSVDIHRRWRNHMYEAKHENLPMYNYPIHRAFRKYGKENFKFEIIEETDELDAREKYWIEFFNSIEEGYNIVNGGGKGPSLPGELNPRARLTNQEVYEIRTRLLNKEMPSSVYKDFQDKISESAFYKIWRGETWKEILPEAIEYTKTSEYIHNIRSFARQQQTKTKQNKGE